jgi:uncharacterized protein
MKYFDASAWIGAWPFAFLESRDGAALARHLGEHGIQRALVSSLDAVFAPAPDPANRRLEAETRRFARLVPVPVVNPTLGNWREELERCVGGGRARIVRVLPNYHAFSLGSRAMQELADELGRRKLVLAIQTRLIDERHEWHGLNIKPVPTASLTAFLARNRALPTLVGGLGRPDLLALLPQNPQVVADLTFAEWHDTLRYFVHKVSARQLAFSSHTPFHITAASKAKVETQLVPKPVMRAVAGENLERLLRGR